MQTQLTEPTDGGLCVASGYGLKLYVDHGQLIVHDGICDERQTRRYHRATSRLKRVVVLGHDGYITLETLHWIRDIGAAFVQIDRDGRLVAASVSAGPTHGALRRAQALSDATPVGVQIARSLLKLKVSGQASLLSELPKGREAAGIMERCLREIEEAQDLPSLLAAEAQAASAYWSAWASLPVRIGGRDADQLPRHWSSFDQRHSPLSNGPRQACNPANAILNYLYALLEAETTLACHTVGLDPTLGIFHTDQRNRNSLALDAMEAVRPVVDAYVLALLTQRVFSRRDFAETRQGACRLAPPLAARLASTIETWRHDVGPIVEGVAQALAAAATTSVATSAPLTHAQHLAAWNDRASGRNSHRHATSTLGMPNSCRDCGTHLADRRRRYCEDCRAQRWTQHASTGRQNAAAVLARLRTEQRDPAHGGRAAEIRGRKNAAHQRAVRDWKGERPDPSVFASEILPVLKLLTIGELVAATGLSEHYCSLIRLGKKVPHPRHWESLREQKGPRGL